MSRLRRTASRVRELFGRGKLERSLDEEVRFHLEMQMEDYIRGGMEEAEARRAALRSFGAVEPMKESYRENRALPFIETAIQDVRFAIRTLRKNPGFTVTAVTVLALAIGANTAMFSVLRTILLRPLPYRSPERLAMLWTDIPGQSQHELRSALPNVEQWHSQSTSFEDMAVFDPASVTLTRGGEGEQVTVGQVSPNFFSLLGVRAILGRTFPDSARRRLALITYRFWQARFGGSPDALGAALELDGVPFQILGILPSDFRFAQLDADIWAPNQPIRGSTDASESWFVVGRLRSGVTLERAQVELNAIAQRLEERAPVTRRNRGIRAVPLQAQTAGPRVRLALWMLGGAVFAVLLIAAGNIASLSLARAAGREREIAVRSALGASRLRIFRQLLIESLALSATATALGLLIAQAGIHAIPALRPENTARFGEISIDPMVLGCAMGLCLLTGILTGLAPAMTTARRSTAASIQEGGPNMAGGRSAGRIRRALVAGEFALAVALLTGAGLLVRSLRSVQSVDPGFRSDRVLALQIAAPAIPAAELYERVLTEIEALPGVESAGVIGDLFIGNNPPEQTVSMPGEARSLSGLRRDEVSRNLFRTLRTPLLRGRDFTPADGPHSARVAIVNETMARRLWPARDPIGQKFRLASGEYTVTGMVGDLRRQGLETEPMPQMFVPLAQSPSRHEVLLVRTHSADALSMAGAVWSALRRVENRVVVYRADTLEHLLDSYVEERRFQTLVLAGFSAAALLMASLGIYGLIQYSIATRTHEIGIRMAIGAPTSEIFRMVLSEGLRPGLAGLAVGLVGALGLGRFVSSLLFGVTARDPLTFVCVPVLLMTVAVAACWFPARRAMRIEPVQALRRD